MKEIGKKTNRACLAALALVGLCASWTNAGAQQPSQAQKNAVRSACRSDYMAHCSSVPPGGQASLACLRQNMATLSPSCQKAVNAIAGGGASAPAQPAAAPPATAPAAEPSPPAPAPEPTPAASAPAAPREYRTMSRREEFALVRGACGGDVRALCGDVPLGGGRLVACLRENAGSLSPRCRGALMSARRR